MPDIKHHANKDKGASSSVCLPCLGLALPNLTADTPPNKGSCGGTAAPQLPREHIQTNPPDCGSISTTSGLWEGIGKACTNVV